MKLPAAVTKALSSDAQLNSEVEAIIARIEKHVSVSKMVFFPEYTDHSIRHIELVLATAVELITEDAATLMTSADFGCLTLAVALHDIGMHLTKDGFLTLLQSSTNWKGVPGIDNQSWSELWNAFYAEATRFDERKLRSLFGEKFTPVRPLPPLEDEWSEFDYLLVGEFLRRHHPRLAQEIALDGIPAINGSAIELGNGNGGNSELLEISGLVARSHGMDLRECVDLLEERYDNKVSPRGIHAPLVMVLLRIADFFQIQATRAPTEFTAVTTIRSPVSSGEWQLHQCIKDVHSNNDPEAIEVVAEPDDVSKFLRLRSWLSGLQTELDKSWASLGEVYGLQYANQKNKLGIRIRRVKSNTDNISKFSKRVNYVPERLSFRSSDAELLKLLVAPLYGDDYSFGVRELIQNAVDAVNELVAVNSSSTTTSSSTSPSISVELQFGEDQKPRSFVIRDGGIGMSLEIVRDYFLTAGASFRTSKAWKSTFSEEHGETKVLRSGRFGVGALSAFLIGDKIEVVTRHYKSEKALKLEASLDAETISVTYLDAPVGTEIRIAIRKNVAEEMIDWRGVPLNRIEKAKLEFDNKFGHFFLRTPVVDRKILPGGTVLEVDKYLPSEDDTEKFPWRKLMSKKIGVVFWTYGEGWPNLAVNGIIVADPDGRNFGEPDSIPYKISPMSHLYPEIMPFHSFRRPHLSLFDREGMFPLNLARSQSLSKTLIFGDELYLDILNDVVAKICTAGFAPRNPAWVFDEHPALAKSYYYISRDTTLAPWAMRENGVLPATPSFWQDTETKYVLVLSLSNLPHSFSEDMEIKGIPDNALVCFKRYSAGFGGQQRSKGVFMEMISGHPLNPFSNNSAQRLQIRNVVFATKPVVRSVANNAPGKDVRIQLNKFNDVEELLGWSAVQGNGAEGEFSVGREFIRNNASNPLFDVNEEVYLQVCSMASIVTKNIDAESEDANEGQFEKVVTHWNTLVGRGEIPFDQAELDVVIANVAAHIPNRLQAWKLEQKQKKE